MTVNIHYMMMTATYLSYMYITWSPPPTNNGLFQCTHLFNFKYILLRL